MNKKQIEERKKYLVLQAFYVKVKQSLEELEKKLNLKPEESDKPKK